jgi:hypothetical protein
MRRSHVMYCQSKVYYSQKKYWNIEQNECVELEQLVNSYRDEVSRLLLVSFLYGIWILQEACRYP